MSFTCCQAERQVAIGQVISLGSLCLALLHLTGVRRLKPHYLTRLEVSMCAVAVCQHLN